MTQLCFRFTQYAIINLSLATSLIVFYSSKSSETESHDQPPPSRSASQRLVDRRGRAAPQRPKTSEDESSGQTLERRKKDKLRMSSRWRRSKSQDRGESPTRSKSKERKIFGR